MQILATLILVWVALVVTALLVVEYRREPVTVVMPPAVVAPVPEPSVRQDVPKDPDPLDEKTLCVRYRDVKGHVVGEEWIDPKERRPNRSYDGHAFIAAREKHGVWEYRWVNKA